MAEATRYSPSELYIACRHGDIDTVKRLTEGIQLDVIDHVESNGNTALHAACYHGHLDIVKLLLKKGASTTIKNKYGCTPFEEANLDVKDALQLRFRAIRFGSDVTHIEWMKINPTIHQESIKRRNALKPQRKSQYCTGLRARQIKDKFIDKELQHMKGASIIREYFDQMIETDDPTYLLKAYTADTDFYRDLNIQLASIHVEEVNEGSSDNWHARNNMLTLISTHPDFDKYSFCGKTYRGMRLTDADLEQYKAGCRLMNKAFLSTSLLPTIAKTFAVGYEHGHTPTLCTYKINNTRSALAIDQISLYPGEHEVLIMPYCAFEVQSIKINPPRASSTDNDSIIAEIELHEIPYETEQSDTVT